jgi:hypothetical protein
MTGTIDVDIMAAYKLQIDIRVGDSKQAALWGHDPIFPALQGVHRVPDCSIPSLLVYLANRVKFRGPIQR